MLGLSRSAPPTRTHLSPPYIQHLRPPVPSLPKPPPPASYARCFADCEADLTPREQGLGSESESCCLVLARGSIAVWSIAVCLELSRLEAALLSVCLELSRLLLSGARTRIAHCCLELRRLDVLAKMNSTAAFAVPGESRARMRRSLQPIRASTESDLCATAASSGTWQQKCWTRVS